MIGVKFRPLHIIYSAHYMIVMFRNVFCISKLEFKKNTDFFVSGNIMDDRKKTHMNKITYLSSTNNNAAQEKP